MEKWPHSDLLPTDTLAESMKAMHWPLHNPGTKQVLLLKQAPNGESQDASEGPEEEPAPDKHFPLPMFASDQDKREFICAGAAAGIAVRPAKFRVTQPASHMRGGSPRLT